MDEQTMSYIKHKVANALMRHHGYDRRDPSHKAEFDPNDPNSQFSMMFADADIAVSTFLDVLMGLEDGTPAQKVKVPNPQKPDQKVDLGIPETPKRTAVKSSAAYFIFMETPPGEPTYVSDVREWLEHVDFAGISDDTEVEGFLHLSVDREGVIDQIECVECGTSDTLLIEHECIHDRAEDPKLF